MSKSQLYLQDLDIDLDDLTQIHDTRAFKMEALPLRSQEKDHSVQMEISIEMNLDQITIARSVYTTLDVLSDIGGIQEILMSGMGMLLGIWNYQNFDNYMASRLYKV